MPAPALAAMAKTAGKSLSDMERYWDQAKASVTKQYGYAAGSDRYYQAVMGIVKKMAGIEGMEPRRVGDAVRDAMPMIPAYRNDRKGA